MDFTLTDRQEAGRELASEVFDRHADRTRRVEVEAGDERCDRRLWRDLADSGVLGLVIPEAYDGAGLSFFEFAPALIGQGRRVCHVPLWETVVLGALPIVRYGDEKQRRHWLPRIAAGEAVRIAQEAGADYGGSDDLGKKIQDGWLEFDATIAMADQMGKVGGLGRILGRRGLMPNPRSGTVVRSAEDLPAVIQELKRGRVEFRNDRTGLIHAVIGKESFEDQQLVENLYALVDAVMRAKPAAVKGTYCRSITLTSTMGPGVPVDVAKATEEASNFAA